MNFKVVVGDYEVAFSERRSAVEAAVIRHRNYVRRTPVITGNSLIPYRKIKSLKQAVGKLSATASLREMAAKSGLKPNLLWRFINRKGGIRSENLRGIKSLLD